MDTKTIGKRVRKFREIYGFTVPKFAQKSGVHINTIRNLEAGKSTSMDTFLKVAKALGMEPAKLVEE